MSRGQSPRSRSSVTTVSFNPPCEPLVLTDEGAKLLAILFRKAVELELDVLGAPA